MRVLIISANPFGRDGISNVVRNLFYAMDKRELHIDLVTINQPEDRFCQAIEEHGGKVYVLQRELKHPLRYMLELKALIKNGAYDLVHAHGSSATLAIEMTAAWLAGCKVRIAHGHSTSCKYMGVHRLLTPLFHLLCTHRLTCGAAAGKWLYGKKPFTVVNNGIDTAQFAFAEEARAQIRSQYCVADEEKLIGHVGFFSEGKNQSFIVEMMRHLNPAYKLLLIGEGRLRTTVEKKVSDLGLEERVIFAGVTDRVPDFLSACDLIVMPSLYEGLPLSLIEQQASGLQCIISDSITQEVDKTGNIVFLTLSEGAAYWAEAVRQLALPESREALSAQAVEKIKACGYDIYTEAEKLKSYYTRAVGGR